MAALLSVTGLLPCGAAGQIVPGLRFPSNEEQHTLQLINHARAGADGLSLLQAFVSNNVNAIVPSTTGTSRNGTAWTNNFWTSPIPGVASSMNYFRVDPGDLVRQYIGLVLPQFPLAWDANLGNVASGYNSLVIANRGAGPGFPHSLAPYQDQDTFQAYAKRYLDGGYGPLNDINTLAENIAPDNLSGAFTRFAAFMIDWGNTPNGIQDQNPDFGSHRLTLMGSDFTEVGLSSKPGWTLGRVTEVQEFGRRFSTPPALIGAVYADWDADEFYTPGEGLGGVTVTAVRDGTTYRTVTQRSGGYVLSLPTAGVYAITATGGFGVFDAGAITMGSDNVLLDVVPPKGQEMSDFNRDDKPDLLLYHPVSQRTSIWSLDAGTKTGEAEGPAIPYTWVVVGAADFNADGHADYCLYNAGTRKTVIWYLVGNTKVGRADAPFLDAGWTLAGLEDFNRDGYPDYLLMHTATRATAIWYLKGSMKIGSAVGPSLWGPYNAGYQFVGTADFLADGRPDFLFYHPSTRVTAVWYLDDQLKTGRADAPSLASLPTGWTVAGLADFNADNHPDYLLYHTGTRQTAIWYLNSVVKTGTATGPTLPSGWNLISP